MSFKLGSLKENKPTCNESDPHLARQTDSETDTHCRVTHPHMITLLHYL